MPTHRAGRVDLTIPAELTRELRALARAQEVTLFMLLLAAFDVLLARYSGQETVVVGTPVAGRTRAETEGLIGFFVNNLALRADVRGSFLALLAQVKRRTLDAFAHQLLPFQHLVDHLDPERSRPPIFQVLFAMESALASSLTLDGLSLSPVATSTRTAKLDLELYVVPNDATLDCSFVFDRDLFDDTSIEPMASSFHMLLEAIARTPDFDV